MSVADGAQIILYLWLVNNSLVAIVAGDTVFCHMVVVYEIKIVVAFKSRGYVVALEALLSGHDFVCADGHVLMTDVTGVVLSHVDVVFESYSAIVNIACGRSVTGGAARDGGLVLHVSEVTGETGGCGHHEVAFVF
jgi:hypothetical protein